MFNNRSKALFISAIISTLYVIYLISYFGNAMGDLNSGEEIGGAIATALVTPHIIFMAVGCIFSWISIVLRKPWSALVGAICYLIGTLLFLLYAVFGIPITVLGFIGYNKQRKYKVKE